MKKTHSKVIFLLLYLILILYAPINHVVSDYTQRSYDLKGAFFIPVFYPLVLALAIIFCNKARLCKRELLVYSLISIVIIYITLYYWYPGVFSSYLLALFFYMIISLLVNLKKES